MYSFLIIKKNAGIMFVYIIYLLWYKYPVPKFKKRISLKLFESHKTTKINGLSVLL